MHICLNGYNVNDVIRTFKLSVKITLENGVDNKFTDTEKRKNNARRSRVKLR